MLNYTINPDDPYSEVSHKYTNQLLLHANSSAPQPGTPPYGYLKWVLIKNNRIMVPIPSN